MKKILAVSGGVDSMVLLHLMRGDGVVVAHFNHGIRENSGEDEDFVRRVAGEYGLEFRGLREDLGAGCGEGLARERRYAFLMGLAGEYGGEVYTAHHRDDLVESVVINVLRGTGWRGLAPMMDVRVRRPLLGWGKGDIYRYAAEYGLRWRQDPTNVEGGYLRNRVREALRAGRWWGGGGELEGMVDLIGRQRRLSEEVDGVLAEILPRDNRYERGWFRGMDEGVALEVLRAALRAVGRSATRPQLLYFLAAVREYEAGKAFNLPGGYLVRFQKDGFVLE